MKFSSEDLGEWRNEKRREIQKRRRTEKRENTASPTHAVYTQLQTTNSIPILNDDLFCDNTVTG